MKRWLALLLVLVLCLPAAVCAEESEPVTYECGDWRYILLEDGSADITWYDHRTATSVELPETLDGHPVTINSTNPFSGCDVLTAFVVSPNHPTLTTIDGVLFNKAEKKLVAFPIGSMVTEYAIPEGILAIGDSAFYGCGFLTTVLIPESVTSLGDWAFSSCASLTTITIPASVTSLGDLAFYGCDALTEIGVSPENPAYTAMDGVLFDKEGKTLVAFPAGDSRTEYTVPDGVMSIGDTAFFGCTSLTTITIPESVTSIGNYTFSWCASLTTITIPESVTSIGDEVFENCPSLQSVRVTPGSYAEEYCKAFNYPIAYIENTCWLNS